MHPQPAYRRFREGTLPVPAVQVNSRSVLVAPDTAAALAEGGGLGLYARVSSHDQKPDLDRQVARVEVGSGMNGARSKARRSARNRAEKALRYAAREVAPEPAEAAG